MISKQSVFEENDDYTDEALHICRKFERAIEAIFDEHPEVSRRELAVIAYGAVGMIECKSAIKRNQKKKEKK